MSTAFPGMLNFRSEFLITDTQPSLMIKRFMKGVFNQRPALPRYQHIWDVNIVLEYLASLSPVNVLSFYTLTLKFVMFNSFVRFTYSLNVFIIQRQLSFLYTGNAMSST
jgi:hypothetical protein